MLHLRIVSPSRVVYEGDASSLLAPAWDGKVGILPRHAPMIALLGAGELEVALPGEESLKMQVAGGVLQVVDDRVTLLTEYAGEEAPENPPYVITPEEVKEHVVESSKGNPLA